MFLIYLLTQRSYIPIQPPKERIEELKTQLAENKSIQTPVEQQPPVPQAVNLERDQAERLERLAKHRIGPAKNTSGNAINRDATPTVGKRKKVRTKDSDSKIESPRVDGRDNVVRNHLGFQVTHRTYHGNPMEFGKTDIPRPMNAIISD